MARFHKDGVPDLSVEEIEQQIERLSEETSFIERWIIARANRKFDAFEAKDKLVRGAWVGGYRTGFEHAAIMAMLCITGYVIIQLVAA